MPMLTIEDRRRILAKASLFASVSVEDVDAIAELATTRSLKAREELFHKGASGAQLYFVASGRLKIITTSSQGDDLMFCVAEPGEVIGEIGLLADCPRTATVIALEASQLIVIDRREFQDMLRRRPDIGIELLRILAVRLARLSEFLEDTHFQNLPARLAKKLADFGTHHGKVRQTETGTEVVIDLKLSQEEWGDLVGTTRESVNKQFKLWAADGLISIEAGRVVIRKLDELEQVADCVAR